MLQKIGVTFLLVLFVRVSSAAAQDCPASVLLSLARSASACMNLERDQACYGNGSAAAEFLPEGEGAAFGQPGDRAPADFLSRVEVLPVEDDVSVVSLYAQASLSDLEQRSVTLLLFGGGALINLVPYTPEIIVTATGTLPIRAAPELTPEIVSRVGVNEALTANGRYGNWLRVKIPNTEDLGWIPRELVTSRANLDTLAAIAVDTPLYNPFTVFQLTESDLSLCNSALPAGLLLQTPNTFQPVRFIVHGAEAQFAGTFFLQNRDGSLSITTLDGAAEISAGGETRFIPAGSRIVLPLDSEGSAGVPSAAEPYTFEEVRALPTLALPVRITIAQPLTPEQIAALTAEHFTPPVIAADVTPEAISVSPRCERTTRRIVTLRAVPGNFYEAINDLPPGAFVNPTLQYRDPDGATWWQLDNSNWIAESQVNVRGECNDIPVTTFIPAPRTNYLSLETCETSNGPLREGQRVTLEFVPPPWESYAAALRATQVDPGRISVNNQSLSLYVSDPIRLGTTEDRYLRTFSATWRAAPGTYRIVGGRREYLMICNITVPVG